MYKWILHTYTNIQLNPTYSPLRYAKAISWQLRYIDKAKWLSVINFSPRQTERDRMDAARRHVLTNVFYLKKSLFKQFFSAGYKPVELSNDLIRIL